MSTMPKVWCSAFAALISVGLASLGSSATAAQPDVGHIIQRYDRARIEPGEADYVTAQRILYQYANCLTKAQRRIVERYLATPPFTPIAAKVARDIATSECLMEGELSFSVEAMRGPMYQSLYRLDFKNGEPPDPAKAPVLNYAQRPIPPGGFSDPAVSLRIFADCAVRTDSAAARRLVLSEIGGIEERDALQQMMPAMSACIAGGDKVTLTRRTIRATVAEVLYRLTMASSGRPALADRR
jgi:hypothetical protein